MKEKTWKDCPSCGAKNKMKGRRNLTETFEVKDYSPIDVKGLSGQFCTSCADGFYSIASERKIKAEIGKGKARQDSERVVASQLIEPVELSAMLNVSRSRATQMLDEGKVRYVFTAKNKRMVIVPSKEEIKQLKKKVVTA